MTDFKTIKNMPISCGVAITWNNSILLVRSTGDNMWYVPKGLVNPEDNNFLDTALRELMEETSIELNASDIVNVNDPIIIDYRSSYSGNKKRAIIYHCPIKSFKNLNIMMDKPSIDIEYLQIREIDVALFVKKDIAEILINPELVDIVRKLNF